MQRAVLAEAWDSYRRKVIPAGAPPEQITETRRSFYAGAHVMLEAAKKAGEPSVSEDVGVLMFEGIDREILEFYRLVKTGEM
jgi:hypothetical protein